MKRIDPESFWNSINTEESPFWPVACVDLDGVLNKPQKWNGYVQHFPVAEGADVFLAKLRSKFNTIVVFTATMPLEFAEEWMRKVDLDRYVDYISNHKVPATVYIDDRAVTHRGDFEETLEHALNFKVHWE